MLLQRPSGDDLDLAKPQFETVVDALRWQAANDPLRRALVFLEDGESETEIVDYGGLDQRIRAVAAGLQRHVDPGDRVLLLYPTGVDFVAAFFACFYVGAIAVPAPPPMSQRALPRIDVIASDCAPKLAIAAAETIAMLERPDVPDSLLAMTWVTLDQIVGMPDDWREHAPQGEDVAFLQYTSGSTASPKGVVVTNRNLVVNMRMQQSGFLQTDETPTLTWLPVFHDMGLIGNVIQPLFLGASCILMPSIRFIQKPVRWLRAISRYRPYTSGGPNFAYDLCVEKITEQEREGLDLSSWQVAFNGAEPIRAETLSNFSRTFAPYGFRAEAHYPCYGLAEGTLIISGARKAELPVVRHFHAEALETGLAQRADVFEGPAIPLVSSGRTLLEQEIRIVDPEDRTTLAERVVGEIWAKGENIAGEFWQRPEDTERDLRATTAEEHGPFLRTGDLGFLDAGELFVTGRLKDLIIVNGRNIYPQDLEFTATRCHEILSGGTAAAFEIDTAESHAVVLVHEVSRHYRKFDLQAVCDAVKAAVWAQHEVFLGKLVLVKPGRLPKTSSGKIMRAATRRLFLDGELGEVWRDDQVAPPPMPEPVRQDGPSEADGQEAEILGYMVEKIAAAISCPPSRIDPDRQLLAFGLDSLKGAGLAQEVESDFGLDLAVTFFLQEKTLRQLACDLVAIKEWRNKKPNNVAADKMADPLQVLPLSRGQRALWFQQLLNPDSPAYSVVMALRLFGPVDVPLLQESLNQLLRRHPLLTSRLQVRDGQPKLQIDPDAKLPLRLHDHGAAPAGDPTAELVALAKQPIELAAGSALLRAHLISWGADQHALLLCCHHIICDGWSVNLIIQDLYSSLRGERAEPKPSGAEYLSYICAQEADLSGAVGTAGLDYWRAALEDVNQNLDLPIYHARRTDQALMGEAIPITLSSEQCDQLRRIALETGVTTYSVLMAVYQILLGRHIGYADFTVGTITAARKRSRFNQVVGYFANPVVVRSSLAGAPTFRTLLRRVQTEVLGALKHQDLPLQVLVEQLHPHRLSNRQPLFQVGFGLTQMTTPVAETFEQARADWPQAVQLGDVVAAPFILPQQEGQFDLNLEFIESDVRIFGSLNYSKAVLSAERAEVLREQFMLLLEHALHAPDDKISHMRFLPAAMLAARAADNERSLSVSSPAWPQGHTLHQLVEQRCRLSPEATAVRFGDAKLSYAELDRQANLIARDLRELGATRGRFVVLVLERSLEMIAAMLAVLKTGAAYIPLDPIQQIAWIDEIVVDANPVAIVAQSHLAERVAHLSVPVLSPDIAPADEAAASDPPAPAPVGAGDLACVIYTSGSTGKPKGVMLTHGAICLRLRWKQETFQIDDKDTFLQVISYSFDPSIWEIFTPLICGGQIVVPEPALQKDPAYLARCLRERQVTVFSCVPSLLRFLVREPDFAKASSLRHVICGGESLTNDLCNAFHKVTGARLEHFYGPTEATIFCTYFEARPGFSGARLPIGKPAAQAQIHLLDEHLQPVPNYVPGQIYIGGEGLAAGYLNAAEATSAKFIADPFSGRPGKLYATGDIGYFLDDGNIQYLGRDDAQVKVRGYRVELGEIEMLAAGCPGVSEVAVVQRPSGESGTAIICYLVSDRGKRLETQSIRAHLASSLPSYMVPEGFVFLAEMPLTANGKIDLASLPAPTGNVIPVETQNAEAKDELEARVRELWEQVLLIKPIGVTDNFFNLGGHSMLALVLQARIEKQFGTRLSVTALFENPTVRTQAEILRDQSETATSGGPSIAIRREGGKLPFFCVGAGNGDVMRFANLLPYFDVERPFYALLPAIEGDTSDAPVGIETLAASYADEIRRLQGSGPYFVGGFSVGGIIAIEVARLLQQRGHEVYPPILLDTIYPTWSKSSIVFYRISRSVLAWKGFGTTALARWLRAIFSDRGLEIHLSALNGHKVKTYPGRLTLLMTKGNEKFRFQFFRKWRRVVRDGVTVLPVPGWHGTMFRKANAAVTGKVLSDYVNRVDGGD